MVVEHNYIINLCYPVIFESVFDFWPQNDNVLYHFFSYTWNGGKLVINNVNNSTTQIASECFFFHMFYTISGNLCHVFYATVNIRMM